MKIILFGAGNAGELYMKNTENELNQIAAISDNDEKKWGKNFNGYPIISPSNLKQTEFDQIVITSIWADAIYQQLTEQIGIPADKIKIAPKSLIKEHQKPFLDSKTIALARELLVAINEYFIDSGITLYIDFGTLLGLKRDADLIAWDDDIDLSVNEDEFDLAVEHMKNFDKFAPKKPGLAWKVSVVTRANISTSIKIELFQSVKVIKEFKAGISKRVQKDDNSVMVGLGGMLYAPFRHFIGCDHLEAFGTVFNTPKDPDRYLEFVYGDWKTPLKDMSFSDYNNRNTTLDINDDSRNFTATELSRTGSAAEES